MSLSMFHASIPVFTRQLASLAAILKKAEASPPRFIADG